MHFEWNIYVRFELESWWNILMSTSQGTYVPIEQTSEAIRVTYQIYRAGGREDWIWELLHYTNDLKLTTENRQL